MGSSSPQDRKSTNTPHMHAEFEYFAHTWGGFFFFKKTAKTQHKKTQNTPKKPQKPTAPKYPKPNKSKAPTPKKANHNHQILHQNKWPHSFSFLSLQLNQGVHFRYAFQKNSRANQVTKATTLKSIKEADCRKTQCTAVYCYVCFIFDVVHLATSALNYCSSMVWFDCIPTVHVKRLLKIPKGNEVKQDAPCSMNKTAPLFLKHSLFVSGVLLYSLKYC